MRDRAVTNPVFAFVAILWLGVWLGVSFLATPVKFQAPSFDLPRALEVGRVTFALSLGALRRWNSAGTCSPES